MKLMNIAQLEFSLTNVPSWTGGQFPRRRPSRAQWWFQRMRQVVERARDWQPKPTPRPEQIWFPSTHRPIELQPGADQRHMCA
jgi:hypothetical protein